MPVVTAWDILFYAETILAQTSNTQVAQLPTGEGESAINQLYTQITNNGQMLLWATEAQNRLARLCLPIYDAATVAAIADPTIPTPFTSVFGTATGGQLCIPTGISIDSRSLDPANQGFLNDSYWYPPTPDGNPTAWASTNNAVKLSTCSTTPSINIQGYFLPAPLRYAFAGATTSGTDLSLTVPFDLPPAVGDVIYLFNGSVTPGSYTVQTVVSNSDVTLNTAPGNSSGNVWGATPISPYIDDFAQRTMAYYLAWMVAQKNQDNTVLFERVPALGSEMVKGFQEIYQRMIQNDTTLPAIFPPTALDAMVQMVKQVVPRT